MSDQFYADSYKQNPDGSIDAIVKGETIHVPLNRIKHDSAAGNPTGRGVIWMRIVRNLDGTVRQDDGNSQSNLSRVFCFIGSLGM